MDEPDPDVFVWTFPLYLLAGNIDVDANGNPIFGDDTFYVAPKADGQHHLAVFTDLDLAKAYSEHCNPALNLQAIGCSPGAMLLIAKSAANPWPGFLIDPSPQGRPSRVAPFSNLIDALEQHFGIQGGANE